jgi:hypothetical protein
VVDAAVVDGARPHPRSEDLFLSKANWSNFDQVYTINVYNIN